jgi:uncharacterized protein YecE (DUF72 family)
MTRGRVRIGLSGWSYRDWDSSFYPDDLKESDRLRFVARHFDTVEVNRSFYSLLRPDAYRSWRDQVPVDFVFAVKGSRFITHMRKLRDVAAPMANFFASGVLELGPKLGPILWQLPAGWGFDADRVEAFLDGLPADFDQALRVASGHDDRVKEPALRTDHQGPIRHVLEVRHPSALQPRLYEMARRSRVAVAVSHSTAWPLTEEITSEFSYLRLHGPSRLYASGYRSEELVDWHDRILAWSDDGRRDVYVYFDNDAGGHAPRNALELSGLLKTDVLPQRG